MMILNFKEQFVEKILAGTKIHTLCRGEKWKIGQEIQFHTGIKTKKSKQFATGNVIKTLGGIEFKKSEGISICYFAAGDYLNIVGENSLSLPFMGNLQFWNLLAKNDGFNHFGDMNEFFMKNGKEGPYQIVFWEILHTNRDIVNETNI